MVQVCVLCLYFHLFHRLVANVPGSMFQQSPLFLIRFYSINEWHNGSYVFLWVCDVSTSLKREMCNHYSLHFMFIRFGFCGLLFDSVWLADCIDWRNGLTTVVWVYFIIELELFSIKKNIDIWRYSPKNHETQMSAEYIFLWVREWSLWFRHCFDVLS